MVSEVPLAPSHPWTHSISMPVIVYKQSSHLWKLKEHFCTEQKEKDHECHLLYFVFSWPMLEFLFLTCTCKPISPRYKLFWLFTTITSCSSCLDCWRCSMFLMSILWEAAFPWVSFYTLQGYLYTSRKKKKGENCHQTHGGFAENHLGHLEWKVDSSLFSWTHCSKRNLIQHYCATSKVKML